MKPLPSTEYLVSCFDYRPDGTLVWKHRPIEHFPNETRQRAWNAQFEGRLAGHQRTPDDYTKITLDRKAYQLHRLIWKMHKAEDPSEFIDHINNNKADNRIENLREATRFQNARNHGLRRNNTSGYKGVRFKKNVRSTGGKWVGFVDCKGKRYRTKGFDTPEEANEALIKLRASLHNEFTCHE